MLWKFIAARNAIGHASPSSCHFNTLMQHCAIVKGWALHTRSRLHSIATPPPTHTCTPLCRQCSRTPLLHCATYIQEQISVFSIQNEHDSFGPEPCTDPKQNGLPYDAERTLRAYSLFLLFLQFQYSLSNGCIDATKGYSRIHSEHCKGICRQHIACKFGTIFFFQLTSPQIRPTISRSQISRVCSVSYLWLDIQR